MFPSVLTPSREYDYNLFPVLIRKFINSVDLKKRQNLDYSGGIEENGSSMDALVSVGDIHRLYHTVFQLLNSFNLK